MYTSYYDSAEDITITRERALQELHSHGIDDPADFYQEVGNRDSYPAQEVLVWLGY